MKARCDEATGTLFLELFHPIAPTTAGQAGTLTLEDGQVVNVEAVAAGEGVFLQLQAAAGETCDLCALDCDGLVNAVVSFA